MNVAFNYNNWWNWSDYPDQKVVFDGPNKTILVSEGVTNIDVQEDIYSGWKEWVLNSPESPIPSSYLEAISTLGGDPITEETFIGDTYFLENGWRIKPWPTGVGYVLNIVGNLYTRETGGNPVLPESNVTISLTRSNITETAIAGGANTENRLLEIWRILGLDALNPQVIRDTSITVGDITLTIRQDTAEEYTTVTRE